MKPVYSISSLVAAPVMLAVLFAALQAADARILLNNGAKVKCVAGCLECHPGGKKCKTCAEGYVLKVSNGRCVCPDGSGSWANQTFEVVDGFPASAPNCGVLPADDACKCQQCPEGYSQVGAVSIPGSICQPVPVDCVAEYEPFPADCVSNTCSTKVTQMAALVQKVTEAKYGGKQCEPFLTQDCTDSTPDVDCTPASSCQVSTCQADGTCSKAANLDAGVPCTTTADATAGSGTAGICDGAGVCNAVTNDGSDEPLVTTAAAGCILSWSCVLYKKGCC